MSVISSPKAAPVGGLFYFILRAQALSLPDAPSAYPQPKAFRRVYNSPPGEGKSSPVELICPSGKISGLPDFLSSPSVKNILIFRRGKSVYIAHRSVPQRGARAIVTNAGRMRWTQAVPKDDRHGCVRRSRVVLDTQCRCRRWLSGLVRRGEHEGSRKTIARGMPGDFRCDRGDYARMLCFPKLHARLRAH
jgi:hypothetical protein